MHHPLVWSRKSLDSLKAFWGLRYSTSSHLNKKLKNTAARALKYHQKYVNTLDSKSTLNSIETQTADEWLRTQFNIPRDQPKGTTEKSVEDRVHEAVKLNYRGVLETVHFSSFGSISVAHNDILQIPSDCILVPLTTNTVPYRGLALSVFELGGVPLYGALQEAIRKWRSTATKDTTIGRYAQKDVDDASKVTSLPPGTLLLTACDRANFPSSMLAFIFLPYYWSSPALLAMSDLRRAIRTAFSSLSVAPFTSISIPILGTGVFGYNASDCSRVLIAECIEFLLQINEEFPHYNVSHINLVDYNSDTADTLCEKLRDASRLWLPEAQVVSSSLYWKKATQRVLNIPPQVIRWSKKHNKVSFKKYHNIPRHRLIYWRMNLRPFIWRTSRVLDPPSLLVYKSTGLPADVQPDPKPFYFRGVTHQLFPPIRSGFPTMRINRHGKFVGVNQKPKIDREVKPRN